MTSRPPKGTRSLQEGIYLERSSPPPAALRLLLVDVDSGTDPLKARDAVRRLWKRVHVFADSLTEEKPFSRGEPQPETRFCDVLLGYGASFFDTARHSPRLTMAQRPPHLVALNGPEQAFPELKWAAGPDGAGSGDQGEADLLFQFTGTSTELVNRCAVEVVNIIEDEALPLMPVATFEGFKRYDGRGWIGFHDGVNNLEPSERFEAVEALEPAWNYGGTFLAFLRLQVDLSAWRRLDDSVQEVIIGRKKRSGAPLVSVANDGGRFRTRAAVDRQPRAGATWLEREHYFNPPATDDPLVEASHVHRANQNKAAGTTHAAHRIFRQGYEYLEDITWSGARLGLTFISFQNDLFHFRQLLGLSGWLGDVNFGGPSGNQRLEPQDLITVRAGGLYAVPPRARPFPGARLFSGTD